MDGLMVSWVVDSLVGSMCLQITVNHILSTHLADHPPFPTSLSRTQGVAACLPSSAYFIHCPRLAAIGNKLPECRQKRAGPGRLPSGYTTSCPVLLCPTPPSSSGYEWHCNCTWQIADFDGICSRSPSLSACGYYHIHLQVQAEEVREAECASERV